MMNKKKSLLLMLIFSLFLSLKPFASAGSIQGASDTINVSNLMYSLDKPDYAVFLTELYGELTKSMDERVLRDRAVSDPRRLTGFASISLELYDLTGDQQYLDNAKYTWDILLDVWRNANSINRPNDFFINAGLMRVYEGLKEARLIDSTDDSLILKVIEAGNWHQKGDDNQALHRALGMIWSARVFPDHPDAELWTQYADQSWDYWYSHLDLTENAGHYSSISLNAVIQMAIMTDREHLLDRPEIRKVFERYRDQLSPSGGMPEYGDDYYGEALEYIYIFEYAARLYSDPTFLEAAWKIFGFQQQNFAFHYTGNFDTDLWSLNQFPNMMGLLTLESTTMEPVMNTTRSKVLTRNEPGTNDAIDKMILATSREPGSSFLMSELFGRGSHAHLNRVGAIQYYEVGGKPYYHGMARHNKGATHSNVVAMMSEDAASNYPYGNKSFRPNTWYHESVPTQMLVTADTVNNEVTFSPLNLRITAQSEMDFIIDNLRLEGPAGVKMIDSFEDLEKWVRTDNPYSLTEDRTEGNYALNINIKPGASAFYTAFGWKYEDGPENIKPGYEETFSLKDYTEIKYDWKYNSPSPVDFSFIFRMIVGTNTGIDSLPGDVNNVPIVSDVRVDDVNNDAFGEYKLSGYFTHDTALTRKMVLTKEGFLIIQDKLEPGASALGQLGGPIWHMYGELEQGSNWFDTPGEIKNWRKPDGTLADESNLLVYFAEGENRNFGVNRNVEIANNQTAVQAVYAKQALQPEQPVTFVTVLVPHDRGLAAGDIANSIQVTTTDGHSMVSLRIPGSDHDRINITLGDDDWKVLRSGDANDDGIIDADDLELVAQWYRKTDQDADWSVMQYADIDNDGMIGLADIAYVSKQIKENEMQTIEGGGYE